MKLYYKKCMKNCKLKILEFIVLFDFFNLKYIEIY